MALQEKDKERERPKKVFFRVDSNEAVQRREVARRLLAALQKQRARDAVISDDRRARRLGEKEP
jgi:hypothetical protein